MQIRHLRIRVNTDIGEHGTDISFPNGLVVLRADNSMGKSTCLRSIIVALGFEAMLTPSHHDLPLPHVLKDQLDSVGRTARVLESNIYLEIENSLNRSIVLYRTVVGERNKDIITVTFGPALTSGIWTYHSTDYFVSRPGAASRELGFHQFLAKFLGWELPLVQTYDGRKYPLYLQCIFPYFMVEQTRGWAYLDPPIPTQFRIREPNKRAVEFILDLDAFKIACKRLELEEQESEIKQNWSSCISEINTIASSIEGVVNRLPQNPTIGWPPVLPPHIEIFSNGKWESLESILDSKKLELHDLLEKHIPLIREITNNTERDLFKEQVALHEKELIYSRLLESFEIEKSEKEEVQKRLNKIEEDLLHNKDVKLLLSLGSNVAPDVALHACPTCHQDIDDSLIPFMEGQSVMSIDDNIAFLNEQYRTFTAVYNNSKSVIEARESQLNRIRTEINKHRSDIRWLKETLISDARLPSLAVVHKRVELEEELKHYEHAREKFITKLNTLDELSYKWAEIQKEKKSLPVDDTSDSDKSKILRWAELFREQLQQYDFRSLSNQTLSISIDTYRAVHEGFDLPSNISASDFIRVIWSYLTGMLELAREYKTNHPGLLIFDEPKQQSTKELSFSALLRRVSQSKNYNQQVIFATSENPANIKQFLENLDHTYIEFKGRIIQPLAAE